ncbi:MAG: LytTR family DNA-binding domain-containing protein [Bacteroidota bacterium]
MEQTAISYPLDSIGTGMPVSKLTFSSTSGRDHLSLPMEKILWIQAQQNYVEFCWQDGEQVHTTLLRTTFSVVLAQLPVNFLQVHRSVVINLNQLNHLSRRHRGLQVKLGASPLELPVSLRYMPQLIEYLRNHQPHLRP